MGWMSRVRGLFRRERLEDELKEEVDFHLAMRESLNLDQGMERDEARRDSRVRFGNPVVMRERMRVIDLATAPETILQDLRYGVRMLRRSGGFTAVAVCALALGIGINTATFTAYKSFFKRPLDGRDSGHLVNTALMLQSGGLASDFSYPDYEAYRDNLHSFDGAYRLAGCGVSCSFRSR